MTSNYKELGDFIEEVNIKNNDLKETNLLGVSIEKKFIPSIANTNGTDFKNYKVIKYNQFAYGPVTSRNGDKISIALLKEESAIISSSYKVFSIKDDNLINPDYLMLWLERQEFDRYARFKSHGSVREIFSWDEMCKVKLPVPDIEVQNQIVNLDYIIKNKIKLSKKLDKDLENYIVNIFKKWFVNFNFPLDDENSMYYCGGFKESELGNIPENWTIDYLGSDKSNSIIRSGINEFEGYKVYLATADVTNFDITNTNELVTFENKPSRAKMKPIKNSVWFAKMINSRKLILVDENYEDILEYIFSTGFCGIKCSNLYLYYLWTFLLTDEFNLLKNSYCTGTTQQAINNDNVKNIKFILPDESTLIRFNKIAKPLFDKIYYNKLNVNFLFKLRELLIPKLMYGEINVMDINI